MHIPRKFYGLCCLNVLARGFPANELVLKLIMSSMKTNVEDLMTTLISLSNVQHVQKVG